MKLLLTSAGVKNPSIHNALVKLLGKPIEECNALCITTASYTLPNGPVLAWEYFVGQATTPMCELGWKSVGVLELTALPSIGKERWVSKVQETDVLLVNGGDTLFLAYWMRESGLAEMLPSLNAVYVGLSAGSLVLTPDIGEVFFMDWRPPTGGTEMLGLVDLAIYPHLDHEDLPYNTMPNAEKWAVGMAAPAYAIDDQTAIQVVDGKVEVISEGNWKLLNR